MKPAYNTKITEKKFAYNKYFHGEKKKHLKILSSVVHTMTKNTFYFGGIGQVTDTITKFWSMNSMFWVSFADMQQDSDVSANSFDNCTYILEIFKTVSKKGQSNWEKL